MMMRGGMVKMQMQNKALSRTHRKQSLRSLYCQKDSVQITGPPVTQGFYF